MGDGVLDIVADTVRPVTKIAETPEFIIIVVAILFAVFAFFILYPLATAVTKWVFITIRMAFAGG